MQGKSARGIQSEDVMRAADALISEGLRPTIERVRQKIGRGSPNTVSPLLDAWFATLATRLGVNGSSDTSKPPEPVQQAAAMLWNAALESARQDAAQALSSEKQALAETLANVEQREVDLQTEKQALMVRQLAIEESLQVARSQLVDMTKRQEDAGLLVARRELEIHELREKLTIREHECNASVRQNTEEVQRHAEERARLEVRAIANERRLLEELDRERQEVKRGQIALTELEHQSTATQAKLEMVHSSLATRLQEAEQTLQTKTQALLLANEHSCELRKLLEDQKLANLAILKQFNLLMNNATRKPLTRASGRRRL